ncbi:Ig-like domain-containing protein [Butyrivibrio sp. AE3004]|uniref:Ig-like domain-containing protein n=1 Tax=Butyrivibrio sp. AE3004 TaxID=1506994 RepID=UPI0006906FEC|nr:Ig-like domain-containing protein [Butyrivibrio sp. AE3004]
MGVKLRITAIVLIAILFVSFSGSGAFISKAENNENDYLPTTQIIYRVNPLYADVVDVSDLYHGKETQVSIKSLLADNNKATSTDEIITAIREGLKRQDKNIIVNFSLDGTGYDGSSLITLQDNAFDIAMEHTGKGDEGDYLKWGYSGMGMQVAYDKKDGKTIGTFTYFMTYYTTPEQEQSVNAKVKQISSSLGLAQKNEYEKILAVYEYMCKNVKYDYGSSMLKYTCYSAAINNSAVCQGYALLIYRLLNDSGVSCRLIAGDTKSGGHGWNIVRVGSYYYNIDATWDAGKVSEKYSYFMKCDNEFDDHKRWTQYASSSFYSAYPMSSTSYNTGKVGSYIPIKSLAINKDKLTIKAGESSSLNAKVVPAKAESTLVWKSSNSSVATVSSNGKVKGIAAGTCQITVSSQDSKFKSTCYVTVTGKSAEVKSLKLNKKKIKLEKGKKFQLKVTISPDTAENTELVWKSSNGKIAKITKKGVVKAKGKGKCKITVMTKDGKKKATCTVTVK